MVPAGDCVGRVNLVQPGAHQVADRFLGAASTVDVGGRFFGVEHGAFGAEVHLHGAVQSFVEGGLHLRPHQQPGIHAGQGVGAVRVGEKIQLRRRCKRNIQLVFHHLDLRFQGLVAAAVTRILRYDTGIIHAVGQGADFRAYMRLRRVQQVFHASLDRCLAVTLQQGPQALLSQRDGAQLRVHVAALVFARTEVGQDHVQDVMAHLPPVHQPYRRDPQPLGKDLFRIGVVTARHRPAHVHHVAFAHHPEHQFVLEEQRFVHAHVRQVAAVIGGVVVQVDVARVDFPGKESGDGLGRQHHGTQVGGDVFALYDHAGVPVEQGVGIVPGDGIDAGTAGLFHGGGHGPLGRLQRALYY